MKRNVPTISLLAAAVMVATLIPMTSAHAAEPWLDEDFENGANGAFNSSGIRE